LTVLLADDHPFLLDAVRLLVELLPRLNLIASHQDGDSALEGIRQHRPDIAVLDICMPNLSGLEVLEVIAREKLPTKVIFLTGSATDEQVAAAIAHDAWGLVLKSQATAELAQCLARVSEGERFLPPDLVNIALEREKARDREQHTIHKLLTVREREIAQLVAQGLSNKQIARQIGTSEGTVKIHLYNVYQKLGVSNRTSLATIANAQLSRQGS